MKQTSKRQSNTSSPSPGKVHGTTVNNKSKSSTGTKTKNSPVSLGSSVLSLAAPTVLKITDIAVNYFPDSSNAETSTTTSDSAKIFEIHTGLPESEPTIILTSEFLPVFNAGLKTVQGDHIGLKYDAKTVNAKTAIKILSNSEGTMSAIADNKTELLNYIEEQKTFLSLLEGSLSQAISSMDVAAFRRNFGIFANNVLGFDDFLKLAGYQTNDIARYSQTKLWQQTLVELKKFLLAHSPSLLGVAPTRDIEDKTDDDPYVIADLVGAPVGTKRIWHNPHTDFPDVNSLSDLAKINQNGKKIMEHNRRQFIDLNHPNPPTKRQKSPSEAGRSNSIDFTRTDGSLNVDPVYLSADILDAYVEDRSGRDLAIMSNFLSKEAYYSYGMSSKEHAKTLLDKFGYTISLDADNFQVWDYVVGRFPRSVLEVPASPTGNGKSLASFSYASPTSNGNTYKVLTFESQYADGTNITPGTYYYIDSALNTADGKSFDTSRLDDLINRVNDANETAKLVIRMSGYELDDAITVTGGIRPNSNLSSLFNITSICNKLSEITKFYKSCLKFSESDIVGLDTDALKGHSLDNDYLKSTRLAAMICKLGVTSKGAYAGTSLQFKSLLFMWIMNVVRQQVDGVDTSAVVSSIKTSISNYIARGRVFYFAEDIEKAVYEGRTFPISIEYYSTPHTHVPDKEGETLDVDDAVSEDVEEGISEVESQLDYAKRQSYANYVLAMANRLFSMDVNKGIWKAIIDLMKEVYRNPDMFVNDKTIYTGVSKSAYMFCYFDLILRIIAAQTPENLLGTFNSIHDYTPVNKLQMSPTTIKEKGLLVDVVDRKDLNDIYMFSIKDTDPIPNVHIYTLAGATRTYSDETNYFLKFITRYKDFFSTMSTSLLSFKKFLASNFESHLKQVKELYDNDTGLSDSQRNGLLNLSLSEEQVTLTQYIMSEMSDRLSESSDIAGKLKSTPIFSDFPDKFIDFLDVNDVRPISYRMLSPYFKNSDFLSEKGNNKRILSVGIPPKLNRRLRSLVTLSETSNKRARENVIRLKVYKLDRLHPDIVYHPQEYLFEMNRFPTRVLSNWDYEAFMREETNLLSVPCKLYSPGKGFETYKDFSTAFPGSIYGTNQTGDNISDRLALFTEPFLSDSERYQIHVNHAVSFLAEEYLKWFTDCSFDETRYHNFSQLTSTLSNVSIQYQQYVNRVKQSVPVVSSTSQSSSSPVSYSGKEVSIQVTDPSDPTLVYKVPISSPQQDVPQQRSTSQKSFVIPVDSTIKTYFENETLLLDPSVYKRRMSYPKKFDRVFHMFIDPDDFYVDESMSSPKTLASMKDLGILTSGEVEDVTKGNKPYRHRDTTPNDVTLDEYFVTIEPYDYVLEFEG